VLAIARDAICCVVAWIATLGGITVVLVLVLRTIICSPILLAAFIVVAVTSNARAADYSLAYDATKGALGPLMTSTVLRPRARTAPRRQDVPHSSFRLLSSTESRVAALRVVFPFGEGLGNELDRGV
jgi:hypothetical protein